jgi:hypothetical protein
MKKLQNVIDAMAVMMRDSARVTSKGDVSSRTSTPWTEC